MVTETILLDVDDFCGVLEAAVIRRGRHVRDLVQGPGVPTCPRALASHRLAVRFYAVPENDPVPGQTDWSLRYALPFIDDELERMVVDGTIEAGAQGCDRPECPLCHVPICKVCGGITC